MPQRSVSNTKKSSNAARPRRGATSSSRNGSHRAPLSSYSSSPVAAHVLDSRVLILLAVLALCAFIVVKPTLGMIDQINTKKNLITRIDEQKVMREELKSEIDRLNDKNYVENLIRERLQLFYPDETPYIINEENQVEEIKPEESPIPTPRASGVVPPDLSLVRPTPPALTSAGESGSSLPEPSSTLSSLDPSATSHSR